MSEYTKKLHYIKNGVTNDITLYTDRSDVDEDSPVLCLKDGNTTLYAGLGDVTDSDASDMRVSFNGQTYAVMKEAGGGALGLRLDQEGDTYGHWSMTYE